MSDSDRITIGTDQATYSRPFADWLGRPMVSVDYPDGERFVTYGVGANVKQAWAAIDAAAADVDGVVVAGLGLVLKADR